MPTQYLPSDYLPIVVQFLAAIGFIVTTMLVTHLVTGRRRKQADKKGDAWECGIPVQGDARTPISVKYFLTAILFVLFDVEIIFMYPWAVNFKTLGVEGFVWMLIFMSLLLAGFYYVIRKGVLKWDQE
jgi:NADH-quinone oxidoreductase subunit A